MRKYVLHMHLFTTCVPNGTGKLEGDLYFEVPFTFCEALAFTWYLEALAQTSTRPADGMASSPTRSTRRP
jgi:hypothetical protein